jgi:hypothetical protein
MSLAGGGTAKLLDAWQRGELDGKPEGLTFTALGHAIVGLDTHKPRRNLVLRAYSWSGSPEAAAPIFRCATSGVEGHFCQQVKLAR